MAQMNISNTLWNDTKEAIIAWAEQLNDRNINYDNYEKITEEIKNKFGLNSKFQDKLNNFFLNHYNEYHRFLEDPGQAEGVIDSWHELEEFLEGISDEEGITLMNMIRDVQVKSGQLNIRMSKDIPGMVEAVSTSDAMKIQKSYIDRETGEIKIIYTFK